MTFEVVAPRDEPEAENSFTVGKETDLSLAPKLKLATVNQPYREQSSKVITTQNKAAQWLELPAVGKNSLVINQSSVKVSADFAMHSARTDLSD